MLKYKDKISFITFLQSLAVSLVVIGHCLPKANAGDVYPLWAKIISDFVYSFHMPLFFVIGGFLLANSFDKNSINLKDLLTFIKNKIKRILVPYISIGTIAYLLKIFIFNKFAYRPAPIGIIGYLKSMLIPCDNPNVYLWFLPTIFFISIICYLLLNNSYKKFNLFAWIILSFIISFFSHYTNVGLFNITGIFNYLFFFLLGVIFFNYKEILFKSLSDNGLIIFVLLMFFELLLLPSFKFKCCNYILNYFTAICGILASFILSNYCCKHNIKFCRGLFDGLYYQIYLLSWFFQCGTRIFYQLHWVNYPIVCIIMLFSSFFFPILITVIIKKYFPKFKIFIGL